MIFGSRKRKYQHSFHDDEELHDIAVRPRAWNSNIREDAVATLRLARNTFSQGLIPAAKDVVSTLDVHDPLSRFILNGLVGKLWGSMPHGAPSYRGSKYQYRAADGSNNNVFQPELGAAGTPYTKTVPGARSAHGAMPDAGDVFDLLMARDGEGIESSTGLSSMVLCHAALITHDFCNTDEVDPNINANSSYLDLAPLYGSCEADQMEVRLGRLGLLKPDTFSDTRLLRHPPGVCIYLILYNRFHNYAAQQILEINEKGRFSLPEDYAQLPTDKQAAAEKKLDYDLFNTARLITCGLYIQIAIHDYVRCLKLVHSKDTAFTLDPRDAFAEPNNDQRGVGNAVSVEFNCLYRFHSPLSNREARWTENSFVQALQDHDMVAKDDAEEANNRRKFTREAIVNGEIPLPAFRRMTEHTKTTSRKSRKDLPHFPAGLDPVGGWSERDPENPHQSLDGPNTFRFTRGVDGKFDDAQLAAELIRIMEDPICQFGAQNVPRVFRSVEVLGILRARQWEVATLNEFREFFGMSRHTHFEDINSDPEIQQRLRDLYEDPDLVELLPGLFCEGEGRNMDPDASLPGNETIALWRAILSDAVSIVRSDRFYTTDWSIASLTAWGMAEVKSNPKINKGSVIHRLFQRSLPGYFSYNSLHLWQPFYTPTRNAQLAQEQGYLNLLDLSGLEDENGTEWEIQLRNGKVLTDFKSECKGSKGRKVRRRLDVELPDVWLNKDWEMQYNKAAKVGVGQHDYPWRGAERAHTTGRPVEVDDFELIRDGILAQGSIASFDNPSVLSSDDIHGTVLGAIMEKDWDKWDEASAIISGALGPDWEQSFIGYFVDLSQEIRLREQRSFQRFTKLGQVLQLDVVADYAIPVVVRFIADFLGFWSEIKTPHFLDRAFSEDQIYRLLENCQNYESHDEDPAKSWERRMAYRDSIKTLMSLADQGIKSYKPYLYEQGIFGFGTRSYGCEGDIEQVRRVRKIAVAIVRALSESSFSHEEIVAVMLSTALEATQKVVATFTETLAYFLNPQHKPMDCDDIPDTNTTRAELWGQIQTLAGEDAHEMFDGRLQFRNNLDVDNKILGYILEAQRFNPYMKIPYIYNPMIETDQLAPPSKLEASRGTTILLDMFTAYKNLPQDYAPFTRSHDFIHIRDRASYLLYRGTDSGKLSFAQRLPLIAITGMVKHAAHLKHLRVAHETAGRLKRVRNPEGQWRYATKQWDRLVAAPRTWNLRFDGSGKVSGR
ncbi:heme peroxidase [Microdochium bolleyi]|uniref:Heme peroxidase n=1 Tax=Microdochium bolleyi TaxID=196109 RepID=A0A136JGT2_9PEZI|nr:heme peroxidase [Microdochium bolleyi]